MRSSTLPHPPNHRSQCSPRSTLPSYNGGAAPVGTKPALRLAVKDGMSSMALTARRRRGAGGRTFVSNEMVKGARGASRAAGHAKHEGPTVTQR